MSQRSWNGPGTHESQAGQGCGQEEEAPSLALLPVAFSLQPKPVPTNQLFFFPYMSHVLSSNSLPIVPPNDNCFTLVLGSSTLLRFYLAPSGKPVAPAGV